MSFLEQCKQKYLDSFPIDWIEKYKWNSLPYAKQSFQSGLQKITEVENLFFTLLSKSVLSGEYIPVDYNKMLDELDSIINLTAHEYSNPNLSQSTTPINNLKNQLYKKYESLDRSFKICLTHYKSLVSLVGEKLSLSLYDSIFNVFSVDGTLSRKQSTLGGFVECVIPLCKADYMLSYAKGSIKELILLREDLQKERKKYSSGIIGFIYQALFDKASFLLRKMLHLSGKSEYSLDFKRYSIEASSIEIESLNIFNRQFDYLHGDPYDKSDISSWQLRCHKNEASTADIILLMKYYQKNGGTEGQIHNLLDQFNKIYDNEYPKDKGYYFDQYSLATVKNYLYNCRFSFRVENKKYSYEDLLTDMQEISQIQDTTGIRNFFPFRKAILFLTKDIYTDLKKEVDNDLEERIDEKISKLKEYLEELEGKIQWCKNLNYYPFQLSYGECLISYKELDINIFIPSTFTKPIDYKPLLDKLPDIKETIAFFRNKLDLLKEKREIQNIKSEISRSERKYIDILGVFTAVIAFLFGTINFHMNDHNDGISQLKSSLSLGVVLLLFSSSIYFLTIPRMKKVSDYFKHPRFWFFGVLAVASLVFLCFIIKDYFFYS